ncbi:hypothetical protein [Streptomyces shenzhenensis]|uniref:hypothetical protein n=1 Tax=Streptomyces shenzhenensis TaxID=943815 RepID=UPI001F3B5DCE|nr:hypothetical protein [Streptomyces shenzhenensis]
MPKSRRGRILLAGAVSMAVMAIAAPFASASLPGSFDPDAAPTDRVTDTSRLPDGWQQSGDRMVSYDGDSTGLHVLVADARSAYRWRTAATLSEPGIDTDQWIGQSCVTGSGDRAIVVYAPRQAVNDQQGFQRGAFAAVVNLVNGTVTKLPELVSMAYFNPGCGDGEKAVLSRPEGNGTQLLTIDADQGKVAGRQTVAGELTSAVPFGAGIAAATGDAVVSVDRQGHLRTLTRAQGTPFRLVPDAHDGLAYQVPTADKKKVQVRRVTEAGSDKLLASGLLGALSLRGTGGHVFVTGKDAQDDVFGPDLPKSWKILDVPAASEVSTTGLLALTGVGNGAGTAGGRKTTTGTALPVGIDALVPGTGKTFEFRVKPKAQKPAEGSEQSPALAAPPTGGSSGTRKPDAVEATDPDSPVHSTTDPDRSCAVTRNDPKLQSLQPSPAMVEWATDLAVQGKLEVRRRTGWNGTDIPSYTPQGLFPPVALKGGGRVPAQIMLGVLSQESNLLQATSRASAGESGNFVQGRYYGNGGSVHTINWSAADCGYGIAQVTSGMARSDTVYTTAQQDAITVDYAADIAAGL